MCGWCMTLCCATCLWRRQDKRHLQRLWRNWMAPVFLFWWYQKKLTKKTNTVHLHISSSYFLFLKSIATTRFWLQAWRDSLCNMLLAGITATSSQRNKLTAEMCRPSTKPKEKPTGPKNTHHQAADTCPHTNKANTYWQTIQQCVDSSARLVTASYSSFSFNDQGAYWHSRATIGMKFVLYIALFVLETLLAYITTWRWRGFELNMEIIMQ